MSIEENKYIIFDFNNVRGNRQSQGTMCSGGVVLTDVNFNNASTLRSGSITPAGAPANAQQNSASARTSCPPTGVRVTSGTTWPAVVTLNFPAVINGIKDGVNQRPARHIFHGQHCTRSVLRV